MNQTSHNPAAIGKSSSEKSAAIGTVQGVSVVASVLLPILAAYIVFYTGLGMPDGTVNQGELLEPPVNISQLQFAEQGTTPIQLAEEKPKWRYVILSGTDCMADCEQLLYTSRQVHIRLGEKANRVERLLVTATPLGEELQQKLKRDHPRLRVMQLPEASLLELHRQTAHDGIADTKALLVDQQGYAMMAYDNQHSGNQLLKDIKRLLKYSYEQ